MVVRFFSGATYRHTTSGDLDIQVIKVSYCDTKRSKLKVKFVSKVTGKAFVPPSGRYDGITNIEIRSEDYQNWSRLV